MRRVKNGRKPRGFMGRLLTGGIIAAAVFGSSLAVPGNARMAYANETETKEPEVRSVNLNIDGKIAGIENPSVPESIEAEWSNGTGTYIYFGNMDRSKVLDSDTTDFSRDGVRTMFLVCDSGVDTGYYNADTKACNGQKKANDWKFSEIYLYMNGKDGATDTHYSGNCLETLFNKAQQAALIENYNTSHGEWEETSGELSYSALDGEKLFLLDAREAEHEEYGFCHTHKPSQSRRFRNGSGWLRSPSASDDTKAGVTYYVDKDLNVARGAVSSEKVTTHNVVIYPAYNIKHSSIFFTAYREEDVTALGGSYTKYADLGYKPTEEKGKSNAWKLSIFDGNEGFAAERADSGLIKPGGRVSVNITSMGTIMEDVDYEQISAMLVDETGTVIAYGKIKDIDGNGIGTVDVKIPESAENGKYTLKLFAEDILYYEEESNNIHTDFDLPSGSLASNAVDFEIEVESRDITEIKYNDYRLACDYSGSALSLPKKDEIIITGASFEDVEFEWYKNSVSEENRITSAPGGAGTYYLVASIPDTGTRRGSSVTSEPIVISPKTVTPYISGSISKVYDGSDSVEGADGTLAVKLDGIVEGDDLLAGAGSIRYADSGIGTEKTVVAEGIQISGADKGNYILASTVATADIGIIEKKEHPLNIPQSRIDVANTVRVVSESLELPDGWEWQDADKEIPAGDSVVATVEYTGDDKGIYQTTSVAVTITREACTEDTAVRFDGGCKPTCTEQGKGHTVCAACGDVMRESVTVAALGHNLLKVDEKAATVAETGCREHWACSRCGRLFLNQDASVEITILEATIPKADGKNTSGSNLSNNKKPSQNPSGGNITPLPNNPSDNGNVPLPNNPSDNGNAVLTPSTSQNNGDTDKDKTEGDGLDLSKDSTDTGQGKPDAEDGNSQENKQQKAGEQFKDVETNAVYTVISVSGRTAAYAEPLDKKQKAVIIPAAVSINGVKYKITAIADKAFKGNKNVIKVKIGGSITTIGKSAFYGCRNLKKVIIGKNVMEIGAKSFYKCISITKVTVPAKVRKIGKSAFYGCSKLKLVDVRTKKLTGKRVGAKAFQNIYKKARIKTPSVKREDYKKLFRTKGVSGKKQVIK